MNDRLVFAVRLLQWTAVPARQRDEHSATG